MLPRPHLCSRPRLSRLAVLGSLCALPLFSGGCVQQEKYDALLMSNRSLQEQVVSLYAGTNGFLDGIPVEDVRRFEDGLLDWFRTRHADILDVRLVRV